MNAPKKAPLATKMETRLEKHGDVRTDNYFWLKTKEDKKVKKSTQKDSKEDKKDD